MVCNREVELPAVDIFVTTADPVLEPPIITVNTVLSLMALDYPSNKLGCYVSDDGCSSLTLYALKEALKFGKIWVPFCKKYEIQVRAPFRYFSSPPHLHTSAEFRNDWQMVKVIENDTTQNYIFLFYFLSICLRNAGKRQRTTLVGGFNYCYPTRQESFNYQILNYSI